jgi:hypothetical protein
VTPAGIVIERVTRSAPLGMRFVDEVTGRDVADSLVVEVYHASSPESRVAANANRSGAFYVSRLPGSRSEIEFAERAANVWSVSQRTYVIEVRDRRRQFQPFTVEQTLPAKGYAFPACLPIESPPSDRVPLFSTPIRTVPTGMAVIRTELRGRITMADGSVVIAPASWAVLDASIAGQPAVRGMADREGRVMIVAPYPEPISVGVRPSSPPFTSGAGLWNEEWPVRLTAFYAPQAPVPGIPDLCRTLAQPPIGLWTDANLTRPVSDASLSFGRELIIPALVVGPTGPPA